MENRTSDGTEHFFAVNVPDSYDPARRYQVRIQLHGGVGGRATNAPVGNGTVGTLTGAEQIYVVLGTRGRMRRGGAPIRC